MFSLFDEFSKLPKGEKIKKPNVLVKTGVVLPRLLFLPIRIEQEAVFTRASLKHLAEKGIEGKRLSTLIPNILSDPDEIRRGSKSNRLLFCKQFKDTKIARPQVVNIEIVGIGKPVIVTAFQSNMDYLSNFELLWRTGNP